VPTEKRQRQKEGQRVRREAALAAARRRQRKRKYRSFAVLAAAIILISVLATTFGSNDKKDSATTTTSTTVDACAAPDVEVDPADKPTIDKPTGPAPTEKVETTDLKVGDGAEAKVGDTIVVNYVGATYDGKEFGASWTLGCTTTGPLLAAGGGFIPGWVEGIPGMKEGGRRLLSIPSSLAYGDTPANGAPAGPLLFLVDLVSIA
jgi:peptidylprolyl isomerase